MFPSPHPPTPFVSRHERFLFPENDYADWKVQASGRGEIARSTMARERESERKEPEIIFLEFFSYLNSLHRSSLEKNVQSTIRWNDFCEKILWLWDGLTDKRWRYIYIYIRSLGPRKTRNGQLSPLPLAQQGYFISWQMIPISGVRNLKTVTESRPPAPVS